MGKRLSAIALVLVLLVVVGWLFVQYDLRRLDPEVLAQQMRAAGAVGPLLLFGLFILQCVIAPLPSEPVMMAAGFVYGPTWGLVLGWAGVVSGAAACFLLARVVGGPFVRRFAPAARVAVLERYLHDRGRLAAVGTLLFVRVFAFSSFDVISYGCGLLRFPFGWFLLATAVGVVPKVFAFTYLGANVVGPQPAWLTVTIAVGTLGFLVLVPWILRRWQRDRLRPA